MFSNLFKRKKKNVIVLTPKFKIGEKCLWYYTDNNKEEVIINDYIIENGIIKYVVIGFNTSMIYEWINEWELYKIIVD